MGTLNIGNASITNSGAHITLSTVPCFSVRANNLANGGATEWSTKGTSANNWTPIPFDNPQINRGNCFNASEFKFGGPYSGGPICSTNWPPLFSIK